MNKSLAAVLVLAILTVAMLGGWLWFEKQSVLKDVEFSEKTVNSLDPNLPIQTVEGE